MMNRVNMNCAVRLNEGLSSPLTFALYNTLAALPLCQYLSFFRPCPADERTSTWFRSKCNICFCNLLTKNFKLSKLVQTCQNWSKLVQIGPNFSKSAQTCPNQFKLVPFSSKLSKSV